MARDKDGQLIPRRQETQETFDRNVTLIKDNWGVGPLEAIPDIQGLRPLDVDELGVDFIRVLASMSKLVKLETVRYNMVAQRDSRIRIKAPTCASDHLLRTVDLKKLYDEYRSRNTPPESERPSAEIETTWTNLESEKTYSFVSQRPRPLALDPLDSDPGSPQMLTRSKRKSEYDMAPPSSLTTAKRTSRRAEITGSPELPQVDKSSPQFNTRRKRTGESAVPVAGLREERLTTSEEPHINFAEAVEGAGGEAASDDNRTNEHSVGMWHRFIETSPSPIINPVRLEVDRLRTNCGDMMFFIEGIARSWKLKPLTGSQKEELACASEVCEMALKRILDGYLQKLENADIIPRILDNSQSSTQASNGNSDMGINADPVALANDAFPVISQSQTASTPDETGIPTIHRFLQPQGCQAGGGLQNSLNDTIAARDNITTDTLIRTPISVPRKRTTGISAPQDPLVLTLSDDSLMGSPMLGGVESDGAIPAG